MAFFGIGKKDDNNGGGNGSDEEQEKAPQAANDTGDQSEKPGKTETRKKKKTKPDPVKDTLDRSRALRENGSYDSALQIMRPIHEENPEDINVLMEVARIVYRRNDGEKAVSAAKFFDKILKSDKEQVTDAIRIEAHLYLLHHAFSNNDRDSARNHRNAMVNLNDKSPLTKVGYAYYMMKTGNLEKAKAIVDKWDGPQQNFPSSLFTEVVIETIDIKASAIEPKTVAQEPTGESTETSETPPIKDEKTEPKPAETQPSDAPKPAETFKLVEPEPTEPETTDTDEQAIQTDITPKDDMAEAAELGENEDGAIALVEPDETGGMDKIQTAKGPGLSKSGTSGDNKPEKKPLRSAHAASTSSQTPKPSPAASTTPSAPEEPYVPPPKRGFDPDLADQLGTLQVVTKKDGDDQTPPGEKRKGKGKGKDKGKGKGGSGRDIKNNPTRDLGEPS